jgi:hypothetical protein
MKKTDNIYSVLLANPAELESRRVEQIVSFCGDGSLRDESSCSKDFRKILSNIGSKILEKYALECLDSSAGRNPNSGLILQDIVNEVGERLGFSVLPGFYRGKQGRIGYDGLWKSSNFSFIVEVKTSDLSIKLEKINFYREQLVESNLINVEKSSILIVLGRQDTGDLEAQIRGSKYAWDIRMIGIDSLFKLLSIKESLNDPNTIYQITELLKPIEYTRVDQLIDIVFSTSSDVSTPELTEYLVNEEVVSSPTQRTKMTSHEINGHTHSSPVNFYDECINRINKKLVKIFIKAGRVTYTSSDKTTNLVLLNSKSYTDQRGNYFWYGFRPNQHKFLSDRNDAHVAFGCGSEELILVVPFNFLKSYLKDMPETLNESGELVHKHVTIQKIGNKYNMRAGEQYIDITKYLI